MKKSIILCILLCWIMTIKGQEIHLTFTGIGESTIVDQVTATNLATGQSVNFRGNETLLLEPSTGKQNLDELAFNISLFPNPFQGSSSFAIKLPETGNVYFALRNIIGQQLFQTNFYLEPGNHVFTMSVSAPGAYYLDIRGESKKGSIRAICLEANNYLTSIVHSGGNASTNGMIVSNNYKGEEGINSLAFTMGDVLSFECTRGWYYTTITDSPTDSKNYEIEFVGCTDQDDKTYKTAKIGEQMWMAENLAYLPYVSPYSQGSDTIEYFYVYNYRGTNVAEAKETYNYKKYGVVYNWEAAKMACPDGWYLPSDQDWKTLEKFLGMSSADANRRGMRYSGEVGKKLKSTSDWNSNGIGDNSSGFTALPGGAYEINPGFFDMGSMTVFWSSSPNGSSNAWYRFLGSYDHSVTRRDVPRSGGMSVRCIRTNPEVLPSAVAHVTESSATLYGNVIYPEREDELVERGFCWSTSGDPLLSDNKIIGGDGIGKFTCQLHDLETNAKYFVRAYLITALNVKYYGNLVSFITADGSFKDPRDSTRYGYIEIGSQTWMTKNLAYLPSVINSNVRADIEPCYYVYGYEGSSISEATETENYTVFGTLYNWAAAISACPAGWHLPSDEEWKVLESYLGMSESDLEKSGSRTSGGAGKKIKSNAGWGERGNGTDEKGFNATPGGRRNDGQGFEGLGRSARFWTSSPIELSNAWYRKLSDINDGVDRYQYLRGDGFSVRCIKD
ncbi:MAG: hypothetical protein HOD37_11715 [Bacteroidetes bacterium]|nr:hypothetical protein [Bacteroidota bacterium]